MRSRLRAYRLNSSSIQSVVRGQLEVMVAKCDQGSSLRYLAISRRAGDGTNVASVIFEQGRAYEAPVAAP